MSHDRRQRLIALLTRYTEYGRRRRAALEPRIQAESKDLSPTEIADLMRVAVSLARTR